MITAELNTSTIEIANSIDNVAIDNTNITSGYDNSYNVDIGELSDLDITVAKKEYTIVGDDIYIPQLYDDAPQWMKDLVGLVVDVSMTTNSTKLINDMNAILQEFAVSYVPLNQYTQSILDLGNEDVRLNALIETLNSNFNNGLSEANAQIINLQMTKASKDEVLAQVIQTLAAELANPNSNLGATVVRLEQAIVTEQTARATSFQALTASMESTNGEIAAKAEVLENALAYVGINEAGASTNTGLSAYLEASDGTIGGADSQLANTIRVTAEGVESKWAYNSTVNVNGVYRKSGFGLTANNFSGAGTQANPYTSEFWIDATKLRFTNSANTGRTAPFTIDASGSVPQVKFDGIVEFSNVNGASQGVVNEVNNGQTTTINGGRITTGSVTANQIAAKTITANQIAANSVTADVLQAGVSGSTVWNGGGLISSNFNGNVSGNIGNPSTGFRLSSNAAGTSADPNIYGAYMRGGTVNGSSIIGGTIEGTILIVNDMYVRSEGSSTNYGKPIATILNPSEYWWMSPYKRLPTTSPTGENFESQNAPIYHIAGKHYGDGFLRNRVCMDNISAVELQLKAVTVINDPTSVGGGYEVYIYINNQPFLVEGQFSPQVFSTVTIPGYAFSANSNNVVYALAKSTLKEGGSTFGVIGLNRITIFNQ